MTEQRQVIDNLSALSRPHGALRGECVADEMHKDETLVQLRQELDLVEMAIANLQKSGQEGQRGRGCRLGLVAKSNEKKATSTSS